MRQRFPSSARARTALAVVGAAAALVPAAAAAPGRSERAPAAQRVAVVGVDSLPSVTVTQSLAGLNDVAAGQYDPPDVQVAAGPGFLLEAVNLAGRVWTTSASPAQEVSSFPLGDFFRAGRDRLTDPRILYDTAGGRWFASISDEDASAVLVAVSGGADPTGTWSVYRFAAGADCADQPRLGTADGIVVVAADLFVDCDSAFAPVVGSQLWVLNKQELLDGAASVDFSTFGPTQEYASLTPAHALSATPVAYVASVDTPRSDVVHLLTVSGTPPAPVEVRQTAAPVFPIQPPPPGLQPETPGSGTLPLVATNDDRVLDAVWENGNLWLSANAGCVPAGDAVLRACGRVAEVATATGTVSWRADVGFADSSVFFPSIRPDGAGNLVVVFGRSSPALAPELAVTARTPDGAFTPPAVVARSVAPHVGSRFGDYFGAARDPSDPSVVWVAGETGPPGGAEGWATTVASVVVGGAGAQPPVVVARTPPGLRARPASGRVGRPVRLSYVALDDGVSVRREVTVHRRGSVVFRATTKPSAVRALSVYSLLWRPRTVLRGSLRFCVRAIGENGLSSPRSCASVRIR